MTRRKRHGCRPNRTPAAGRRDRRQSIGPPQPFPGARLRLRRRRATADSQSARLSHSPPRDVRGKRNPALRPSAGCLLCNPRVASFRLAAHGTRTRPQTPLPFGEWTRACLSRGGSGGARVSRGEFFGPDGTGDAPVHLAGPMRKRKPEVLFTSRSPVGGIHRADRRVLRSKMATVVCPKKLGASCSPRRSDGQRVCQPLPSRKIRDKGAVAVGCRLDRLSPILVIYAA